MEKKFIPQWYVHGQVENALTADGKNPQNSDVTVSFCRELSPRLRKSLMRDFGLVYIPESELEDKLKEQLRQTLGGYSIAKRVYEEESEKLERRNKVMEDCLSKLDSSKTIETPKGDMVFVMSKDRYNDVMAYKQPATDIDSYSPSAMNSPFKEYIDESKVKEELTNIFGKHGELKPKYYWRAVLDVFNKNDWSRKTKISLPKWAEWVNSFIYYSHKGENPLSDQDLKKGNEKGYETYIGFQTSIEENFFGEKIDVNELNKDFIQYRFINEGKWTTNDGRPLHICEKK